LLFPRAKTGVAEAGVLTDKETDEFGRFAVEAQRSDGELRLFVTGPTPPRTIVTPNLVPPFNAYGWKTRKFSGMRLTRDQIISGNVGDVAIQVWYGTVEVYPVSRIYKTAEDWSYVGYRIKTGSGRLVEDAQLSRAEAVDCIRGGGTGVAFALPVGEWQVELQKPKGKGWIRTPAFRLGRENQTVRVFAR
jgi:hypothetical protein